MHANRRKIKDLAGKTFTRLVAMWPVGYSGQRYSYWLCLCVCGHLRVVRGSLLSNGTTKSCGCLQKEHITRLGISSRGKTQTSAHRQHNRVHGHSITDSGKASSTYNSWLSMRRRALNADGYHPTYADVDVCERWRNSFEAFLSDMGPRPPRTTLGRFVDTGNYEPSNCAWMTRAEQNIEKQVKRGELAMVAA